MAGQIEKYLSAIQVGEETREPHSLQIEFTQEITPAQSNLLWAYIATYNDD
jgi:hypothetical protein